MEEKKLTIICGHYGCGKTNFSINVAVGLQKKHGDVTLVDLDLVNPYFRSSDFRDTVEKNGIKLIAPVCAHSNLDIPSIPAEMYSVFDNPKGHIVIDVGGDDVGATALGRFSKRINSFDDKQVLYVVNKFRPLSEKAGECFEILNEIEAVSRVKITGVVNNSHLMNFTTAENIISSVNYAEEIAKTAGVKVEATAVRRDLAETLNTDLPGVYPIDIYVKTPWDL